MKKYFQFCLAFAGVNAVALFSFNAHAMPDPLGEATFVVKYIAENQSEIIDSSIELAKRAVPDAQYFLVADKIDIYPPTLMLPEVAEGIKPSATIHMKSANIECERDVYTKVHFDAWGAKTDQKFFLKQEIRCIRVRPGQ
jgi:hypothetical protein